MCAPDLPDPGAEAGGPRLVRHRGLWRRPGRGRAVQPHGPHHRAGGAGEDREREPQLAASIRDLMFVFDDILLIDDLGIAEILKRVDKSRSPPRSGHQRGAAHPVLPEHVVRAPWSS